MKAKAIHFLAWALVITGALISLGFLISTGIDGYTIWGRQHIDFEKTGEFGDFIGGFVGTIISAAGFIFLYLTLKDQRESFEKERFEQRFFEMIRLHRENVSELSYTSYNTTLVKSGEDISMPRTALSRKVFKVIFSDFEQLDKELRHFFADNVKDEIIYEEDYLKKIKANKTILERNIDLVIYAKVDILYCIIYFGLSKSGIEAIKNILKKRYRESFFNPIIRYGALKPKEESENWRKWKNFIKKDLNFRVKMFDRWVKDLDDAVEIPNANEEWDNKDDIYYRNIFYDNNYYKYYGGHQFRLSHYLRHFYHTITYINKSKLVGFKEKYENIKFLRGQLSTFEQLIIFLDSLSILGRMWELEKRNDPSDSIELDKQLITKYNLIKNISNDLIIEGLYASHFYPLVSYESDYQTERIEKRQLLKKRFSERKNKP